jgi:hypothetical protein
MKSATTPATALSRRSPDLASMIAIDDTMCSSSESACSKATVGLIESEEWYV